MSDSFTVTKYRPIANRFHSNHETLIDHKPTRRHKRKNPAETKLDGKVILGFVLVAGAIIGYLNREKIMSAFKSFGEVANI